MVMREKLIVKTQQYESDGSGGRIRIGEPQIREIECNASLNADPEIAGQYGVNGEQVLIVFSWEELQKGVKYIFKDKNYAVRFSAPRCRMVYSILVEEKE
jgi:hypothetical protein